MIINGKDLLDRAPIENMILEKERVHGVSRGLSEAGYDISIKQTVKYFPPNPIHYARLVRAYERDEDTLKAAFFGWTEVWDGDTLLKKKFGRTALASSVARFHVPTDLWGELRNKSTHARCFVDASITTDTEPDWKGYLTIELIFHDLEPIVIKAGSGILKAVFHELKNEASYEGSKYQNQPDRPVSAILDGEEEECVQYDASCLFIPEVEKWLAALKLTMSVHRIVHIKKPTWDISQFESYLSRLTYQRAVATTINGDYFIALGD